MAQGAIKQKKAAPPKKSNPTANKGTRVIKPKKQKLIEQQKMAKKISSGITAKTERALAERAGHLELLAGGKKSKGAGAGAASKGQTQKNKKSGR